MFESDLAELHHSSWQSWGTHCLHWLMQNFPCPLLPVKVLVLTWLSTCWTSLGFMGVVEMLLLPHDNLFAPAHAMC